MRIGILADIHKAHDPLRRALAVLKDHRAGRFVVLGDVCGMHTDLEGTVALLAEAGAIGVWGTHNFGLCRDHPTHEDRLRYSERVLDFMGRLRPRLEIDDCLFHAHRAVARAREY